MTQLNEKEQQLVALLSDECETPAELTAKLKSLFDGALEKGWGMGVLSHIPVKL